MERSEDVRFAKKALTAPKYNGNKSLVAARTRSQDTAKFKLRSRWKSSLLKEPIGRFTEMHVELGEQYNPNY